MKHSNLRKICAVLMAATLGATVLTGCGSSSKSGAGDGAAKSGNQVIEFNLGSDLKTLDPALNQAVDGGIMMVNAFEGLYKLDENDKPIPGTAESCTVSDDGLTYTFKLRSDAKWSNGDPVKASDFEYSWKRVIDPATAAEYAYQMMYIKGAEEFNSGKGSADDVAVKAIDDSTLEVTLAAPCSYFLSLTAFPCYFPVNQKVVEEHSDWALSADNYVSNGPFKMTDYKMKDGLVLEKNDNYYDKEDVTLDKVDMKFVSEETSAWASYKSGQFDMVYTVPKTEIQSAVADGSAKIFPLLGTYYYSINVSDKAKANDPNAAKALSDPKVRKALNLAIDRDSIVKNVTKGEQIPAHGFVPQGIKDDSGKDFADKEYFPSTGNVEEAKKLLAEAGYPDGQGFPSIVLLFNPESGHGDAAQAVQDMWKNNLGIDVQLQSQEWKVFQVTRNNKDYQVARDGWVADYTDPMTFLDMLEIKSGQNNAGYANPEYDKLVDAAKAEQDASKRLDLLHQAEDTLMEDMPILPLYYYTQPMGVKDTVKGVKVSPLGFIYFDKATVEGK